MAGASLIDWSQLQPQGPGPSREVASMNELLRQLGERRVRQQQWQAERDFAEKKYQSDLANQQADNKREEERIRLQDSYQNRQLEQQRTLKEAEMRETRAKESRGVLPDVYKDLKAQDVETARARVQAAGGSMAPVQPKLLDLPAGPTPEAAGMRMAGEMASFGQGDVTGAVEGVEQAGERSLFDQENQRRQQAVQGMQQISLPGSQDIFMSDQADVRARLARGEQAAADLAPMGSIARSPHQKRAYAELIGKVRTGLLTPDDAIKQYEATVGRLEGYDEARLRAMLVGSRVKPVSPSQQKDDLRADMGQFSNDYTRWEKNNNLDKLTDDYDKFQNMGAAADAFRNTGNTIDQRESLYQAARLITGPGVLTAAEYNNTVQNTAGVTPMLMSKIKKGLTGEISDTEWAVMEQYVSNAQSALKKRAQKALGNFDKKYGPKSYYQQMVPDEVGAARESLAQRFGLQGGEVPPTPTQVQDLNAEAEALLKGLAKPKGGK